MNPTPTDPDQSEVPLRRRRNKPVSGKGTFESQIRNAEERLFYLKKSATRRIARADPRGSKLYSLAFALERVQNIGDFDEDFMRASKKYLVKIDAELDRIAAGMTGGKK